MENKTQRLGAYAVCIEGGRILLTRISPRGFPPGSWTLPGGGVDHGESPRDAVERELYEETGLTGTDVSLLDVHSIHVVDVGRGDRYEDYHGVHVLYRVTVDPAAPLEIIDIDGSTDVARWVKIAEVEREAYEVLPMVTHALRLS